MDTAKPSKPLRLSPSQERTFSEITKQMANTGSHWEMPWHKAGSIGNPRNVASNKHYRGFNRLALMLKQAEKSYTTCHWGTMRQWNSRRSQVLAGEKAVALCYPVFRRDKKGNEHLAFFRPFWVFNGNQVRNYNPNHPDLFGDSEIEPDIRLPALDQLIQKHQARVSFGGDRAYYNFVRDQVVVPRRDSFIGSTTSTADEAFYATLLHELIHWTGHETRLNREHHQEWGDDVYALEELIAEIGAAFLCCDYEITNQPRADHAKYLNGWLRQLRNDQSLLWKAASKAQKATDFLVGHAGEEPTHDHKKPPGFALEIQPTQPDLFP